MDVRAYRESLPNIYAYGRQRYSGLPRRTASLPSYLIDDCPSDTEETDPRLPRGINLLKESVRRLSDSRKSVQGDLGWSLAYATAHIFKAQICNRFPIVSCINDARKLDVSVSTPFVIFDAIDKQCFEGKLQGAVLLQWKALGSDHPGITYATNERSRRINVMLNTTPFEGGEGHIDLLLEMLIHHMIHAYFLVCCGAQKHGERQDGRMNDGVHFGNVLYTINEITYQCKDKGLNMRFHAAERCGGERPSPGRGRFVAVDPRGMSLTLPLANGHSHCTQDNRSVNRMQISSWQVETFSRAINENWESRGNEVYFWTDGRHRRMKRMEGPPSRFYGELIWDGKRFAVPRTRAARFVALRRLIDDSKHGDMKVPDCSAEVFDCLWHFVTFGGYGPRHCQREALGPPVLLSPHGHQDSSTKLHIQVCKLADQMRFPELQQFALRRLYEIGTTSDDPIAMLRDIYDTNRPLSVELQSWTRRFLTRTGGGMADYSRGGASNYEKINEWHQARFARLYAQHAALREDCVFVVAGLRSGIDANTACPPDTILPPEEPQREDATTAEELKQLRMLDKHSTMIRRGRREFLDATL